MHDLRGLRHGAHEIGNHRRPFGDHRTLGDKRGRGIRDFQIGSVHHVVITFRDGLSVSRRRQVGHFKGAAQQGRERFGIAAGLQKTVVAIRFHVIPAQGLDGKVMGVSADATNSNPFSFEVLRLFDVAAGHQRLGHDVFDPAYENHIGGTFDIGRDVADAAGDRHLGIAAEQCRGDDGRRGNKHQIEI